MLLGRVHEACFGWTGRVYANDTARRGLLFGAVAALGVGIALLVLLGLPGLALVLPGIMAAGLLVTGHLADQRRRVSQLGSQILAYARTRWPSPFDVMDLDALRRASVRTRRHAVRQVYGECYRKVVRKTGLTDRDREELDTFGRSLGLGLEEKRRLEKAFAPRLFCDVVSEVVSERGLTIQKSVWLKELRERLQIEATVLLAGRAPRLGSAYRQKLGQLLAHPLPPAQVLDHLRRFEQATGLTPEQSARLALGAAPRLFGVAVGSCGQDAASSESDLNTLWQLADALGIPQADCQQAMARLGRDVALRQIRSGALPRTESLLHLHSTELCHFEEPCDYASTSPTSNMRLSGTLTVTNSRVILRGEEKSFEFSASRILKVDAYGDAVDLTVSVGRGQGRYYVDDGERLAAILETLIGSYAREDFATLDAGRSRHIPDEVKVEVWRRDGGQCAKCGSTEELEFDHIIPFSKGGSNSANNIQLLCRRCNLAKRDGLV